MFNYESCMRQSVVGWMQALKLIVKSEFTSPWGICDLVGLQFNKRHVAHRLKLGQTRSISSMTRAALLLLIPDIETHKSITMRRLACECASIVQPETVIEETQRLVTDGFVICRSGDRLQKINGWMPLQKRFIAVELKLKRVEEAMLQAESNFGFADESYIALPEELAMRVATRPARRKDFLTSGVGLLSVTPKSSVIIIRSRRRSAEKNPVAQLYSIEKFWQTCPKGN
jgi:hypothetical protein